MSCATAVLTRVVCEVEDHEVGGHAAALFEVVGEALPAPVTSAGAAQPPLYHRQQQVVHAVDAELGACQRKQPTGEE